MNISILLLSISDLRKHRGLFKSPYSSTMPLYKELDTIIEIGVYLGLILLAFLIAVILFHNKD